MAKPNGIVELCIFGTLLVIALFNFGLACAEAHYLRKYAEYSDECRKIWEWILSDCVFGMVASILGCCSIAHGSDTQIVQLANLGSFAIAIWCAVVYNNISQSCFDFWNQNAPELLTIIKVNYIMLLIACSLVGLIIVLGCCVTLLSSGSSKKVTATTTNATVIV